MTGEEAEGLDACRSTPERDAGLGQNLANGCSTLGDQVPCRIVGKSGPVKLLVSH